jgi:nucleotide-binding universal stress UspA family protein
MQKILVPTDFSTVAENAFDHAIELAGKFHSTLYLCHIYHFHKKLDYVGDYAMEEQPFIKDIQKKMRFTKERFKGIISRKDLSVQTIVEENNFVTLFKRKVLEHDIDLVVMGSKGASNKKNAILGSVASTAIETAQVPLMIIPPRYTFKPYEQIALAVDTNEIDNTILSPLQKIAQAFNASIKVLNVNSDSEERIEQKEHLQLDDIETTYHNVPMQNSVNESINDFVHNNEVDIVCMIRRKKGFFQRLFKKSVTKSQVYNSTVPTLILPEA